MRRQGDVIFPPVSLGSQDKLGQLGTLLNWRRISDQPRPGSEAAILRKPERKQDASWRASDVNTLMPSGKIRATARECRTHTELWTDVVPAVIDRDRDSLQQ